MIYHKIYYNLFILKSERDVKKSENCNQIEPPINKIKCVSDSNQTCEVQQNLNSFPFLLLEKIIRISISVLLQDWVIITNQKLTK